MTIIAFLRHGLTEWNVEKRVQGLRDVSLSDKGRAALTGLSLPARLSSARWYTSPLIRAVETSDILNLGAMIEPLLIEMDWGDWEGRTVAQLRAADPEGMKGNEQAGRDFRPPGGESPREVQARLQDWAEGLTSDGGFAGPFGAVTHKGVIRAAVALALDWDMREPDQAKLDWTAVHILRFKQGGAWEVLDLNVPLERAS